MLRLRMRRDGRIWYVATVVAVVGVAAVVVTKAITLTLLKCSTRDMFIRGSVVRYVHLPAGAVDTALLEDATRREAEAAKNKAK